MIEVVKNKKPKKKQDPYYILKYEYMIGDADGNTSETVEVLKDNPYLERYVTILERIKPCEGHWGIVFEWELLDKLLKEEQISKEEYEFLGPLMFEGWEGENSPFAEDDEHAWAFCEGVMGDTEYSFLVFQGFKLKYVDEYGVKHKTKIK